MSELTPNLGLFKYSTDLDGKQVFSIDTALNDNWDILDEKVGSGLPIGTILSCMREDTPEGFHRLNGETYSPTNNIQSFQDFITDYLLTDKISYITFEEYEIKLASQNNNCEIFGYDKTTNSIRFPKIQDNIFISQMLNSGIGYNEAGLPNITGILTASTSRFVNVSSGCFYITSTTSSSSQLSNADSSSTDKVAFDASRSNNIYGNSETVTPENVQYPLIICIFNTCTSSTEAQYSGFVDGMASKCDINLSNCVQPYVIDSFCSATEGYIKYSNQICEQWGYVLATSASNHVINLPFSYSSADYNIQLGRADAAGQTAPNIIVENTQTVSTFTVDPQATSSGIYWRTIGY